MCSRQTAIEVNAADIALLDAVRSVLEGIKAISPIVTIEPGQEILFVVAHDMAITPYQP